MGKRQRIVTTVLWAVAVVSMLGLVGTGLWARKHRDVLGRHAPGAGIETARVAAGELPVYYDAPQFSLTSQSGQTVTDASLRGSVWVGMVFFTHCPDICPGMMGRLVDLQEAVNTPDVKLVSFTLDPERDTPEQLKQYADRLGADSARWFLLTGAKEEMFAAADGLKLAAVPEKDGQPITHTGKMLLIDRAGKVRGVYDSDDDDAMRNLAHDALKLAGAPEKTS